MFGLNFCKYIFLFAASVSADLPELYNDMNYDEGRLGPYPTQRYVSDKNVSPRLNVFRSLSNCDDGSQIFLGPHGHRVEAPGPMILDANGSLIWTADGYGKVYNFRMQEYLGKQYITFWKGDDTIHGHGKGNYHMLDQHYKEFRKISAGHGLHADLHEFIITPQGTALMTIYQVVSADVSVVGSRLRRGYIWDGVFQETDIETGKVLFEWKASEHFDLTDSYRRIGGDGRKSEPWDWFHINSIDKDNKGNYLVSSRYLRNLMYIDGRDGHLIWVLGGKKNRFTDLSDGAGTEFAGQHDARWAEDFGAVTLFDNGGDWETRASDHSRGVRIALDTDNMTARLDQAYTNPNTKIYSSSQGSMQTLPNGNVFLGYGYNGAFTQFHANGSLLCDAHFGPSAGFDTGNVQSYRNLRFNWTGQPTTPPSLVIQKKGAYISWLGATEVRSWTLQDADRIDGFFEDVVSVDRDGFETEIPLTNETGVRKYVRVVAKNGKGASLGTSGVIILNANLMDMMQSAVLLRFSGRSDVLILIAGGFLLASTLVASFLMYRCGRRRNVDGDKDSDMGDEESPPGTSTGMRHISWPASPFGRKAKSTGAELTNPHRRNNSVVLSDTDLSDDDDEPAADTRLLSNAR